MARRKGLSTSEIHSHLTAELMLTSDCNMACSYCIAHDLPKATLSVEKGMKAIDLFISLGFGCSSAEITLTGGEPLIVFPLAKKLICYAEEQTRALGIDPSFVLKTNGTILNESIIDFICEHHLKVVISIDGDQDTHDRHRLTKQHHPTHSLVLHNLKLLLERNVECVASVTIHPDACSSLSDNVHQLYDLGLKHIDVGPTYDTVKWSESNVSILIDSLLDIGRYIRKVRSSGGELELGPLYRFTEHVGGALQNSWGCHAGSTNLAFMPNGQIVGCSSLAMLTTRFPGLIIGDVKNGMYGDVLDRFLEIAQASVDRRMYCKNCKTAPNCTGGCLAINLSQCGSPFSPPNFYCRTISVIPKAWHYAWDDTAIS